MNSFLVIFSIAKMKIANICRGDFYLDTGKDIFNQLDNYHIVAIYINRYIGKYN